MEDMQEVSPLPLKVRIHIKAPDEFFDGIEAAARQAVPPTLLPEAFEAAVDVYRDKIREALAKWVEYGEFCTMEFDIEAGTAKVLTKEEQR